MAVFTILTHKLPITTIASALSSACDFKSHFCKQYGSRSDCPTSSLIRAHTVCLYAKIGLKSLQEYSADDINRRHFQMQVFWHFKGEPSKIVNKIVADDILIFFYYFLEKIRLCVSCESDNSHKMQTLFSQKKTKPCLLQL